MVFGTIIAARLVLCWRFYFVGESVSSLFYLYFFQSLFILLFLVLVFVCPEREQAIPQPRFAKPPNTTAEEFLNRQAEVFSWSNCVPFINTFVKDIYSLKLVILTPGIF